MKRFWKLLTESFFSLVWEVSITEACGTCRKLFEKTSWMIRCPTMYSAKSRSCMNRIRHSSQQIIERFCLPFLSDLFAPFRDSAVIDAKGMILVCWSVQIKVRAILDKLGELCADIAYLWPMQVGCSGFVNTEFTKFGKDILACWSVQIEKGDLESRRTDGQSDKLSHSSKFAAEKCSTRYEAPYIKLFDRLSRTNVRK